MSAIRSMTALFAFAIATTAIAEEKTVPAALDFKMQSLEGKDVDLADKYAGKVVLFVNVASRCGLTPQYEGLQSLHKEYGEQGLAVVGVPCNQFGRQEPGSADEIADFCQKNYGVEFDMLAKVDVNGSDACPLYKHLTALDTEPEDAGAISWNFEKFLVGRTGDVVARFSPRTKPSDKDLIEAIEGELAKTE
ncbi:MAG: glutathione peroxidase [Planctomycetota bacterium]